MPYQSGVPYGADIRVFAHSGTSDFDDVLEDSKSFELF